MVPTPKIALLTCNDVARLFGVTSPTVRRWVREQRIPCIKVSPRVIRFRASDILGMSTSFEKNFCEGDVVPLH